LRINSLLPIVHDSIVAVEMILNHASCNHSTLIVPQIVQNQIQASTKPIDLSISPNPSESRACSSKWRSPCQLASERLCDIAISRFKIPQSEQFQTHYDRAMSRRAPRALRQIALSPRTATSTVAENHVCLSCLFTTSTKLLGSTLRTSLRQPARSHKTPTRTLHSHSHARTACARDYHRNGAATLPSPLVGKRHNGSLASSTAINAPSTVPLELRELHQRLNALQDSASGFVDLSRLQLALRSLESAEPVIRVAFLGMGEKGALAARGLARVLVADALGDEEEWEQRILGEAGDARSLLLRYGEPEDALPADSPMIRTLLVPSPMLKRHGLEILVTGLNGAGLGGYEGANKRELESSVLVPSLSMPMSNGGRIGFVRYPVHKALIVGEGVEGAVECGQMLKAGLNPDLIASAINLAMTVPAAAETTAQDEKLGKIINIDLASHALGLFRESRANGVQFSEEWEGSGVSAISEWITAANVRTSSGLKQTVEAQIDSALESTAHAIDQIQLEQTTEVKKITIADAKRAALQDAITTWSAEAHKDLQMNITTALESRSWHRTAWFRLLWRIDDVTFSAADILQRSWLHEAEQNLAFLSGRIVESGIAIADELKLGGVEQRLLEEGTKKEMQTYEAVKDHKESVAELMQMPAMLSRLQEQSGVNALFDPPWPQMITLSRATMLHTLVPNLHRRAQMLLVKTLTTIGGTSALGAWLMVASAGTAAAEAGAVAALGLVWSLRRMQTKWGARRNGFELAVRENGRRVLADVEGQLRHIVQQGGRVAVRPEDVQTWQRARDGVDRAREALSKTDV